MGRQGHNGRLLAKNRSNTKKGKEMTKTDFVHRAHVEKNLIKQNKTVAQNRPRGKWEMTIPFRKNIYTFAYLQTKTRGGGK